MRRFTLTEQHALLLSHLNVDDGMGTPEIDAKRPWGSSDADEDVLRLLGHEPDENGEFTHEESQLGWALVAECCTALQVALHTLSFEPGAYVFDRRGRWRRAP